MSALLPCFLAFDKNLQQERKKHITSKKKKIIIKLKWGKRGLQSLGAAVLSKPRRAARGDSSCCLPLAAPLSLQDRSAVPVCR